MPVVHGDVADCPSRSSPEWAAQKEFALLTLVAEHGTSKTKKLFLQKQRIITMHLQSTGGQPSQRRAATGAAAQQNAGRRPAHRRSASSRGASAARRVCDRSTSPPRCGLAFEWLAACWRGVHERAPLLGPTTAFPRGMAASGLLGDH